MSISITSDNKFIFARLCKKVTVWNFKNNYEEAALRGYTKSITSVIISSDDKFIVSGSEDMTVRVWNLQEKCQEAVFKGHGFSVTA